MAHLAGSITLYHKLPVYAETRARQLGLKRHTYLTLLLANFLNAAKPEPLHGVEAGHPEKLKRIRMQVTIPDDIRKSGQNAAARLGMSFSRLMECLLILDAQMVDQPFVVHPVSAFEKPVCQLPPLVMLAPPETQTSTGSMA